MKYYRCSSYPTAYHGRIITPDIFVWHSTHGGAKAWLDQLFSGRITNSGSKITVHFGLYKDGDLVEYAPWKRGEAVACWHAGLSEWEGRNSANFFSLGCEIQHAPGEDFTVGQLEAIEYLTRMVQAEYPAMRHTTHKFISGRLQGKSDPYSPQWESQAWPVIAEAIRPKEAQELMCDCYNAKDRERDAFTAVRVLSIHFDMAIREARDRGDDVEVARLRAKKAADIAAERKQLGI
jgi:N-acetyl-anhydromuramyl-L-alanine amidase AmpD